MTLPEGWVEVPIITALEPLEDGKLIHQGMSPRCFNHPSPDHETWGVLKTTSIQNGNFIDQFNKELPANIKPKPKLEVREGDILLTCAGPRSRCGVVTRVQSSRPRLLISGKMYRFRALLGGVDSAYLEAILRAEECQTAIDKMKTGGSESGLNLTHDRFEKLLIKLAPESEQRRIVAKLGALTSRFARARADLNRVPVLAEQLRRSTLEVATSSDQGATTQPLRDCLERVRTGPFGSAVHKSDYVDGGVPLVNPVHIKGGRVYPAANVTVNEAKARQLKEFRLAEGDVILGRRGEMGRCAVVRDCQAGFLIGTGSMAMRPVSSLISDYLQMFLSRPTTVSALERAAVGSTMINLNQKILLDLPIFVPSLAQQRERIDLAHRAFARADRLEAEAARASALIDRLEFAIFAKAFRGELVPQDPNDEPANVMLDRIRAQRAGPLKPKRGRDTSTANA